jgi:hypothetical protein
VVTVESGSLVAPLLGIYAPGSSADGP